MEASGLALESVMGACLLALFGYGYCLRFSYTVEHYTIARLGEFWGRAYYLALFGFNILPLL